MTDQQIVILAYVAWGIVIFLLLREIMTWYWKINRIVKTLDRIDNNLKYIAYILKETNPDIATKIEAKEKDEDLLT